jgi:hypothetical protein
MRASVALAVLALTACSGQNESGPDLTEPESGTDLTIVVSNGYGERSYTLTCDPPGGTVPDPGALCERVEADAEAILFTPADKSTCVGGPGTQHVQVFGRFQGRAVDTSESDLCEGNMVAHRAWQSLTIPRP